MLNEAERRKLADIEAGLSTDDPRLAHDLSAGAAAVRARRVSIVTAGFVVVLVATVWSAVLVVGVAAGIAAGLTLVAVACGLLLQRRVRSRTTVRATTRQ